MLVFSAPTLIGVFRAFFPCSFLNATEFVATIDVANEHVRLSPASRTNYLARNLPVLWATKCKLHFPSANPGSRVEKYCKTQMGFYEVGKLRGTAFWTRALGTRNLLHTNEFLTLSITACNELNVKVESKTVQQRNIMIIIPTLAFMPMFAAICYSLVYLLAGGGLGGAILIFIIAKMLGK
jgi:hypothetical protein